MTDEEARAERKRRQKQAQEEFRQKQMMKQKSGHDDKHDLQKASNSFDKLLMDIPTQDIDIEESGSSNVVDTSKRKSPAPEGSAKKRGSIMRLDIVKDQ